MSHSLSVTAFTLCDKDHSRLIVWAALFEDSCIDLSHLLDLNLIIQKFKFSQRGQDLRDKSVLIWRSKGLISLQSVGSVVFTFKHYRPLSECREIGSRHLRLSHVGTHCPLHSWLAEISRNKACLLPTSMSTLFPDLLAQMIAFSTSMDTATNIAI